MHMHTHLFSPKISELCLHTVNTNKLMEERHYDHLSSRQAVYFHLHCQISEHFALLTQIWHFLCKHTNWNRTFKKKNCAEWMKHRPAQYHVNSETASGLVFATEYQPVVSH